MSKDNTRINIIKLGEDENNYMNLRNAISSLTDLEQILISLKITANNLGYKYIKDAVLTSLELMKNNQRIYITKDIYPSVARTYYTTPSRVERAIRHSINKSFATMHEIYSDLFGGIPSNSEFIYTLCSLLASHTEKDNSIDAVV